MLVSWIYAMLAVLLILAPEPGTLGAGDPYYPQRGSDSIDVQHTALALRVDVESGTLEGTATLEIRAVHDLSSFALDLEGLSVQALRVDGAEAAYDRRDSKLIITPAAPLAQDARFVVEVEYGGKPQPMQDVWASYGWIHYGRGIFIAAQPNAAATWHPSNDHPIDASTYSFEITVDEPYVVLANGLQTQEPRLNAPPTATYFWEASDPIPAYLATLAIGRYQGIETTSSDGLPLRYYFEIGLDPEDYAETLEQTEAMLDYLSSIFGPYPMEAFGLYVVNLPRLGFALETNTMSIFAPNMLDDLVLMHELAHHWIGNDVRLASWQDIWLNEGFATYTEVLWIEHTRGADAATRYLNEMRYDLGRRSVVIGDPGTDQLFNIAVYLRGAWTLHALRERIGDEHFFDLLRRYYAEYAGQTVRTSDFIALAQAISGEDLAEFFDAWLYQEALPPRS